MPQPKPLSDNALASTEQANPRSKQLGQLLVSLGILARTQLEKALEVQRQQSPEQRQPVGQICVDQGFFSRERLSRILDRPDWTLVQCLQNGKKEHKINVSCNVRDR